jgi:hypothetical protein
MTITEPHAPWTDADRAAQRPWMIYAGRKQLARFTADLTIAQGIFDMYVESGLGPKLSLYHDARRAENLTSEFTIERGFSP